MIAHPRSRSGRSPTEQIALLETFADQAVIAIENARLFEELEQRNAELQESNRQVTEALEQQTATAEILRVIASSPTDVQPVLDAVAERAARLCDTDFALVMRVDGDSLRRVARYVNPSMAPAQAIPPSFSEPVVPDGAPDPRIGRRARGDRAPDDPHPRRGRTLGS